MFIEWIVNVGDSTGMSVTDWCWWPSCRRIGPAADRVWLQRQRTRYGPWLNISGRVRRQDLSENNDFSALTLSVPPQIAPELLRENFRFDVSLNIDQLDVRWKTETNKSRSVQHFNKSFVNSEFHQLFRKRF